MPCRCKTKNTKPCNAYDGTKYAWELDTILKKYSDPQTQMCRFGGYIADIYEDARLVNVAIGELRLGNVNQIHDEILKKLESMVHARWRDTKIGGYPIPYCCELETLQQMYTVEELSAASVTTALSTLANHPNMGPAGSELEESNITDYEEHYEMAEESTDTELSRQTHITMMITSDQEKHRLEALTREQDCACDRAMKQVQTWHLSEIEATTDAPCCSFKCCSASGEEDSKRTREESPEYGTTPWERGCSLQWKSDKHKADCSRPHQVKGVWNPRVSHPVKVPAHHATILRVDITLRATVIAAVPHLAMTVLTTVTLHPGNGWWTWSKDQYNQHLCSLLHRRHQN